MIKKLLITLLILAFVLVPVGVKALQIHTLTSGPRPSAPADTVTATAATESTWEQTVSAVGSLAAVQGVTMAAETPGKVVAIEFTPGSEVKAGDLLIKQDTTVEQAQLSAAEASTALARSNLGRAQELMKNGTIAKSELDAAEAQDKQAVGAAENFRAVIAKKTIRAPFAGRLGIRLVNLGQMLKEGEAIVSLQALDPIYANFSVPQQKLSLLALEQPVRVTSDAQPGVVITGKITAINPDVDAATRNVRVQATLANPGEKMRPGMFVNVEAVLPEQEKVVIIPATAILYAPYGDSVYLVDNPKDGAAGQGAKVSRQQFVRLGRRKGDFVSVVSGLKAGDMVVTSGTFKLHNGGSITVDNTLAPKAELNPKPADS